jgi:hypothetical protein
MGGLERASRTHTKLLESSGLIKIQLPQYFVILKTHFFILRKLLILSKNVSRLVVDRNVCRIHDDVHPGLWAGVHPFIEKWKRDKAKASFTKCKRCHQKIKNHKQSLSMALIINESCALCNKASTSRI